MLWFEGCRIRVAFTLLVLIGLPTAAWSETRRALLVGIDKYTEPIPATAPTPPADETSTASSHTPPSTRSGWIDLDGAVNDADAMKEILVSRYGFAEANVRLLRNAEASRDRVLAAFRDQLVTPAKAGDVGVFFYAGHGSRVRDSRSAKEGRDQTIVPADAVRNAWDITDKELQSLMNDALDKGVILTAFFDSCHSGSIARGLETTKVRLLPEDERDYAEHLASVWSDPRPRPWERGALVFEAARETQAAREWRDNGIPHGAFTAALMRTLREMPINQTAEDTFAAVKARVSAMSDQLPQLETSSERRMRPLFGTSTVGPSRPRVAVREIGDDGAVVLLGGRAVGLGEGTELTRSRKPEVRLRVEVADGLARATAKVITGNAKDIQVGDLFEVTHFASRLAPLRVWIPPGPPTSDDLDGTVRSLSALRGHAGWMDDPAAETPTHVLMWSGETWMLNGPAGTARNLGPTPSADAVTQAIGAGTKPPPKLFVCLPLPPEALRALSAMMTGSDSLVTPAKVREDADYLLVGRAARDGHGVEYAWVRPNAISDPEHESPLPVRTDWIPLAADTAEGAAERLDELALRLARINAWLNLDAAASDQVFPYRLVLETKKGVVSPDATLVDGTDVKLFLQADPASLEQPFVSRYVYVVALDSFGHTQLLFPYPAANIFNLLPSRIKDASTPPPRIELPPGLKVSKPFGRDTYILLTSEEEVPDPSVFEQAGVRTRGKGESGSSNPLQVLFGDLAQGARGGERPMPKNWSISRLFVRSVAAAAQTP